MSQTSKAKPDGSGVCVYIRTVAASEILETIDNPSDAAMIDADATLYAVHLEDGVRMAVFTDREAAFDAARAHGAQPVSVH